MVATKGDLPMGAYQFQIVGKAIIDGRPVQVAANAKAAIAQSLNAILYPPMQMTSSAALAVKEKCRRSARAQDGIRRKAASRVARRRSRSTRRRCGGFVDEITLVGPTGLPPTIPVPKIAAIPKDKNEISFALDLNAKTAMGEYFDLDKPQRRSTMGKEYRSLLPPLMLVLGLPLELKIEPAMVSLKPGEKAKLKVTAVRKGGYAGPITLDVRKLPAGVTAGKAILAADKSTVEIDITAAATAVPGDTAIDVAGTATALNNLQNASPTITIRVQKK